MQVHSSLTSNHLMPVNERIPNSKHGSVGEAVASSPISSFKRVRRSHRELHEELFAPVKVFVEQALNEPLGGFQAQRPTSSRTANVRLALPQTASSPPSSPPPVPPLPMSKSPPLRMPFHNGEARHGGSSTPPSEVPSPPTDRLTFSHGTRDAYAFQPL
jgi:hypothetical protein